MKVRKYDVVKDFETIRQWGREWGAEYNDDQFPNTGFIVDGLAAYFLYQTDSDVCWLENMITKKGIEPFARSRALDLLVEACLQEAREQGFTVCYATTNIMSVAKRAQQHGAKVEANQYLITKDLTTKPQIQ